MAQSHLGRLRTAVFRYGARPIRAFLEQSLRDKETYDWLLHTLGNNSAMTPATIEETMPGYLTVLKGFEDCHWLFSSNPMNHAASRLRFDEAAWLYKFVHEMRSPSVVEIGRYKGGTALLLAVAGAKVLSLDNGALPGQERFTDSLINVLRRFSLDANTVAIIADALSYPTEPDLYDLVFLDNGLNDYGMAKVFFDYWWKTVKPGGYFLFRDGKDTVLTETARYVEALSGDLIGGKIDRNLPGAYVLCVKGE